MFPDWVPLSSLCVWWRGQMISSASSMSTLLCNISNRPWALTFAILCWLAHVKIQTRPDHSWRCEAINGFVDIFKCAASWLTKPNLRNMSYCGFREAFSLNKVKVSSKHLRWQWQYQYWSLLHSETQVLSVFPLGSFSHDDPNWTPQHLVCLW